ncbi:MAG: aminotransferase class I/II-fold pyridoxal phosphate-dependent enzyme, partial [Actinobacteria bacterium]|nr:aminotransferase class I/II-fold pyridoxal phosphate-dependent enzyme [Actinomycetota bacterium]
MSGSPVRDDLVDLEGYHSPQVEVDVRLNTNESPYPPPDGWREAFLAELAEVPYNRYPDRSARALREAIAEQHGVSPDQVLAAKGSNEVLQALCLAYGGPGRSVAVFEPTYALHSHIARITGTGVAVGERRADFTLDLDEVHRLLEQVKPAITFLC